jgi:hypothetical protein
VTSGGLAKATAINARRHKKWGFMRGSCRLIVARMGWPCALLKALVSMGAIDGVDGLIIAGR